jgi:hypothetical protein
MSKTMSDKQRTIYLHIGTGKTGTTGLQQLFNDNYQQLLSKDILYAKATRLDRYDSNGDPTYRSDSNILPFLFNEGPDFDKERWYSLVGVKSQNHATETILNNLHEEVASNPSARNILISAEGLISLQPENIAKLKALFSHVSKNIRIIAYIRRPREYAVSVLHQRIMFEKLTDHAQQDQHWILPALQAYADVFGANNMIVSPFDPKGFYQGNLYADFLHHLNLESIDGLTLPTRNLQNRSNASYEKVVEYKKLLNETCSLGEESLYHIGAKLMALNLNEGKPFTPYSEETLREIDNTYAHDFKEIEKRFRPNKEAMFQQSPRPSKTVSHDPHSHTSILAALVAEQQLEILNLRIDVDRLMRIVKRMQNSSDESEPKNG